MTVTEARHAGRPLGSGGLESVSGVLGARPETGRSADRDREMVGNDEKYASMGKLEHVDDLTQNPDVPLDSSPRCELYY